MVLGNPNIFAIECHHDRLSNEQHWVFGRMCLRFGACALGDITEPACLLNVTAHCFERLLERVSSLVDPALDGLDPRQAFEFLDHMLYLDEESSLEEVKRNSRRFSKFNFLTNGGESFDDGKSFIVSIGDELRVLFRHQSGAFHTADVPRDIFTQVTRDFLRWVAQESRTLA